MKYIVFTSSGSYSNFSVDDVMVGEKDPTVLLDELVDKMSDGRWKTFNFLDTDANYGSSQRAMDANLILVIRKKAVEVLKENGFVSHEYTEVWLG